VEISAAHWRGVQAVHDRLYIAGANKAGDRRVDENHIELDYSRRGKPTDNATVESVNRRLRAECLNSHWFLSTSDAQPKPRRGGSTYYDEARPDSALAWSNPAAYARRARLSAGSATAPQSEISSS
jgi:putative transposase